MAVPRLSHGAAVSHMTFYLCKSRVKSNDAAEVIDHIVGGGIL